MLGCVSAFIFNAEKFCRFHKPSFIYLLSCQWTLGCFQHFCFHKQCCSHMSPGTHAKSPLTAEWLDCRAYATLILTDIEKQFSQVALPRYSPTSKVRRVLVAPHSSRHLGLQTCTLSHMAMSKKGHESPPSPGNAICWFILL